MTDVSITSPLILAADIISILATGVVLISIILDKKRNQSYNLQLIFRLLLSDFGLCSTFLIYYCIVKIDDSFNTATVCSVCLPFIIFFLISSFSWTVMLAIRFSFSDSSKLYIPQIPFWTIWLMCFLFILPSIILNAKGNKVLSVEEDDSVFSCSFNHRYQPAIIVDSVTFQFPLLATVFMNIYAYIKGFYTLKNSPRSVVARYMRRCGGYLLVLLIVWIPNLAYNISSIITGSNSKYNDMFDAVIFLMCSQGFLNVCVYIWSHNKMKKWLLDALCIHKIFTVFNSDDGNVRNQLDGMEYDDDDVDQAVSDLTAGMESSSEQTYRESSSRRVFNDSFSRNSGILKGSRTSVMRNPDTDDEGQQSGSILGIKFFNRPTTTVNELDSEKFVRFGETTTRFISSSFSSFISSLRSSMSLHEEEESDSDARNDDSPNEKL